jgi:large subunit ribosomal protein L4
MPETILRKLDGTSGGNVSLSDKLFSAKINPGLMHQAVVNEATNSRQDTRDTKTRAEVAGGGRKPYRQKGTGRARQGTISAPHYRHGGIVFGPHPRDLSAKLPKKARRAALASALSTKAASDVIIVLDTLTIETHSTKAAAAVLKSLGIKGKALIVLPDVNLTIYKSFRNIPGITVRVAPAFSVRDVLDAEQIVMTQGALSKLDNIYGSSVATTETEEATA